MCDMTFTHKIDKNIVSNFINVKFLECQMYKRIAVQNTN